MKYFVLALKHKAFVFWAGLATKAPLWRLLIHDWTKLLPCELPHYSRQFFGKADDPGGFIRCWVHHQNSHPHHWEYWIPRTGHNRCDPPYQDNMPIPMPEWAVKEMVADWIGASRAYDGRWPKNGNWPWLMKAFPKMRLHPQTRNILNWVLFSTGKWKAPEINR